MKQINFEQHFIFNVTNFSRVKPAFVPFCFFVRNFDLKVTHNIYNMTYEAYLMKEFFIWGFIFKKMENM